MYEWTTLVFVNKLLDCCLELLAYFDLERVARPVRFRIRWVVFSFSYTLDLVLQLVIT